MTKKNELYTGSGVELVRRLASQGVRIFTLDQAREIAPDIGLSMGYLRQALHHLTNSGWLVRLRKGLYAISSTVPGVAPIHEFEIAMALVRPAAISHWTAMHHHHLTEQIPRRVFILTTTKTNIPRIRNRDETGLKSKNLYRIKDVPYQFVQVNPQRFFGVHKVWIGETRVNITNVERTLLDCLTYPRYCGDFPQVLHSFRVAADFLDLERIMDYALKLDAATAKRLGWILENQGFKAASLEPLLAISIKGYRLLDPTGSRKGRCNRRWMIQENLPGMVPS